MDMQVLIFVICAWVLLKSGIWVSDRVPTLFDQYIFMIFSVALQEMLIIYHFY